MTEWGLAQILMICVPATLTGVLAAAVISMFLGKDLKDDAVYQARLKLRRPDSGAASRARSAVRR
jgi:anaerobic C4-dicarboxylate transporter DcuA